MGSLTNILDPLGLFSQPEVAEPPKVEQKKDAIDPNRSEELAAARKARLKAIAMAGRKNMRVDLTEPTSTRGGLKIGAES